jgi:4a-hydroxytetrahydrobiopterin dehydratase
VTERLSADAITTGLAGLSGWSGSREAIARTYAFADFRDAMLFVNGVAALAERAGHHPDVTISYNRVSLSLSTHSAGGVTRKDLDLARAIDQTFGR